MTDSLLFGWICRSFGAEAARTAMLVTACLFVAAILAALWFVFSRKNEGRACRVVCALLFFLLVAERAFLLPQTFYGTVYGSDAPDAYNASIVAVQILVMLPLAGLLFAAVFFELVVKKKALLRAILLAAVVLMSAECVWLFSWAGVSPEKQLRLEPVASYETPHEAEWRYQTFYSVGSGSLSVRSSFMPGEPLGWTYEDEDAWLAGQDYDFDRYTYLVCCGWAPDTAELKLRWPQTAAPYPLALPVYELTCFPEPEYDALQPVLYLFRIEKVAAN